MIEVMNDAARDSRTIEGSDWYNNISLTVLLGIAIDNRGRYGRTIFLS